MRTAKFSLSSMKVRLASAGTSRFALVLKNNEMQPIKVKVHGCYPEKINLGLFPNIRVLEAWVDGINKPFFINMYFVGTRYTHKTTYFCDYQVKAVTALLNLARHDALVYVRALGTEIGYNEMCKIHRFESKTQGS